jgi:predicted nucleic acid-binding protein
LDSNVVIASLAEAHEHHEASIKLFSAFPDEAFAVAAHSYAEAYSILTRKAQTSPFKWSAVDAIAALESVASRCVLVGLTHAQTLDAIRNFAADGGIGPRLYDKLIGEAAVHNGIGCVITWNESHLGSLFPSLDVVSPKTFVRRKQTNRN